MRSQVVSGRVALFSCVALGSILSIAQAAPSLYASAGGTYGSANGTVPSGSISRSSEGSDQNGQNNQRATAAFGVLRTFANSNSVETGSSGFSFFSQAIARSVDDWTFNAPGRAGQSGSVTVRFTIDGSLSVTNTGSASTESSQYFQSYARAGYRFGQAPQSDNKQQTTRAYGMTSGSAFLGIEQTATLNFTFGQTVTDVTWQVSSITNAAGYYNTWTAKSISDVEHAATWGGFASVKDGNGNAISDYTFSAASGFDWAKTVRSPGDANFDGAVNFDDLLVLAQNYGTAASATFGKGDFTGDGAVNFDDLLLLAQRYGQSAAQLEASEDDLAPSFAADWAMAQSLVPEPSTLGIVAVIATVATRPRRREMRD